MCGSQSVYVMPTCVHVSMYAFAKLCVCVCPLVCVSIFHLNAVCALMSHILLKSLS